MKSLNIQYNVWNSLPSSVAASETLGIAYLQAPAEDTSFAVSLT